MTVAPFDSQGSAADTVAHFERSWRALRRSRRRQSVLFIALFALALAGSIYVGEVRPDKFVTGLPGLFDYIGETLPRIRPSQPLADLAAWYWALGKWLWLLLDTLVMAFLGTLLGAIGAFLLCFPAARNLARSALLYWLCRRALEFARTVPELVVALILVFAFGLGPLPGVMALALHTTGALGKLFAEVNENIDMRPVEGVRAAGGGWVQVMGFAVVPQVLPNFLSYGLLRFEINVRAASVLGFVGAGGIGQELMFVIRQFIYTDISAIVLLIILVVFAIDVSCEKLRHRLVGKEALL